MPQYPRATRRRHGDRYCVRSPRETTDALRTARKTIKTGMGRNEYPYHTLFETGARSNSLRYATTVTTTSTAIRNYEHFKTLHAPYLISEAIKKRRVERKHGRKPSLAYLLSRFHQLLLLRAPLLRVLLQRALHIRLHNAHVLLQPPDLRTGLLSHILSRRARRGRLR